MAVFLLAVVGASWSLAPAATSSGSGTVGANVLPATSLNIDACAYGTDATRFGPVTVSSTHVTDDPCRIVFGSSNTTSSLRIRQTDKRDTAMVSEAGTTAVRRAATIGALLDIEVGGGGNVWAVGGSGLAASTDDGASWTYPAAGVTVSLNAVTAWSPTGAVAVGASSRIRRTADGISWSTVTPPVSATFYEATSVDAGTIYVTGSNGIVLYSDDGGASFTERSIAPITTANVTSIAAVDDQIAWATAGTSIYKTEDAGLTWESVYTDTACDGVITAVMASSTNDVIATVGWGTCGGNATRRAYTTDGGENWTTSPFSPRYTRYESIGPGTLVAVTTSGYAISTDGGATFGATIGTGTRVSLRSIVATSPSHWLVVGDLGTVRGTTNDGADWTDRNASADRWLESIDRAPDGSELWTVGDQGRVLRSTDEGAGWSTLAHTAPFNLWDVVALGSGDAVAVGDSGFAIRTDDEGATWTTPASNTSNDLRGITRIGQTDVLVAVGLSGTIIRSPDLGATWATVPSGTAAQLNDVTSDGTTLWAVGSSPTTILTSTDGGLTWTAVAIPGLHPNNTVSVSSPREGVVWIGSYAVIAVTTNGGTSWNVLPAPQANYAPKIHALSETHAVAVNHGGYHFVTWNGGADWTLAAFNPTHRLNAVVGLATGRWLIVTDTATALERAPSLTISDYDAGSHGWSHSDSMFGACLDALDGGAYTNGSTWTQNAGCTKDDDGDWYAVPTTPTTIAHAPTSTTNAIADLRFGIRISDSQRSGRYVAPITFEVLAPSV